METFVILSSPEVEQMALGCSLKQTVQAGLNNVACPTMDHWPNLPTHSIFTVPKIAIYLLPSPYL